MNLTVFKVAVISLMFAIAGLLTFSVINEQNFQKNKNSLLTYSVEINDNTTFKDKSAYAVGASLGHYLSEIHSRQEKYVGALSKKKVIAGFIDALFNNAQLSEDEVNSLLKELDDKIKEEISKEEQSVKDLNAKNSKEYLEDLKAKDPDLIVTESGLMYKILVRSQNTATEPTADNSVLVSYTGSLINGNIFDKQVNPVMIKLSQMIKGLQEGIMLMNVGDEFEFYIPSNLAYGDNRVGKLIEPNSALIFKVKLTEVK